jgi:transcriptional regulator with XRE-family HTH domain
VNARGRLGREIREIRRGQKMTQGELAEKANVSLLTVSRLERGERDPHLGTLARIARGLGVPPLELLRSAGYFEHDGDSEMED